MLDQSSDQLNTTELKFSREQGFFDKSPTVSLLIGCFFALGLFFFFHTREVPIEVLDLNNLAPSYIVAQHDADFYDQEATVILRQEAVRDIGKIYKLSNKSIQQRKLEFENFILYSQEWSKGAVDTQAFENMFHALDKVEKILLQIRFTDPRTLQKMKEVRLRTAYFQIYTPNDVHEEHTLPTGIWNFIKELAFPGHANDETQVELIMAFMQKKPWKIEEDIPAELSLYRLVQNNVPDKYTHLSAGSRIIDKGERVTPRHIAMMLAIKEELSKEKHLLSPLTILGSLILSVLLTIMCGFYLKIKHPYVLESNRRLFLLVAITLITLCIAKIVEFFLLTSTHLYELVHYPLIVPVAAILICSLISSGIAIYVSGFLTVILTLVLVFDSQGFMIMNFVASIVAILTTRTLRRRKEIFVVCAKAWLACILVAISIHLYNSTLFQFDLISDILSMGIFLLVTAILVVGSMPLLESSFNVMTDATLMEYMDPNNDLLRRLSIEAPGTYQHSVIVGNLAETAAIAIGANGLFCRVATLYHDIGKMATPQYFTENQQPGTNVHQLLTPLESAQVILAHVPEGVAMARKAGLPEQFIDIIKEHHGTTLVYYFYRKQLELVGGDKSLVDEREFRYSGPKPRSKESVIIMIADSFEAASRSMDKISEESLMELASRLIRDKAEDRQFDDSLLTFEEMAIVKATLVKTLVAFGHGRVKYPRKEEIAGPIVES